MPRKGKQGSTQLDPMRLEEFLSWYPSTSEFRAAWLTVLRTHSFDQVGAETRTLLAHVASNFRNLQAGRVVTGELKGGECHAGDQS